MDRVLALGIIVIYFALFVLLITIGAVNPVVLLIAGLLVFGAAFCLLEEHTLDMLTELLNRLAKWMERK